MKMWALAVIAVLAVAGCNSGAQDSMAPPAAETGVKMTGQMQAKMGVRIGSLAAAKGRQVQDVYARVVDAGPLALISADATGARATANASNAEARRLKSLADADQSAAPKQVEAALAQAANDEARAAFAEQRIGLEWGPGIASLGPGGRASLLDEIAAGRAALVRLDATNGGLRDVKAITLRLARDGAPFSARALGPAIAADPRLQAAGAFALVRGPVVSALPAGKLLYGDVAAGAEQTGVLIPREALVRMDGATWVYVPTGVETFERKEITGARPLNNGWFVGGIFKPGDKIVIDGAGALLAVERGPEEE